MDRARDGQVTGPGLPPVGPFERLRRTHSLMVAGDTAMAVALADSLFLSISPDAARGKVLLFLAVSMAPFVVIGPWMGKRIDRMRGGHRMLVIGVGVLRAVVLVLMSRSLDSLTLFPLAFSALVLGKTYAIAKSAIVPTTVRGDRALVESNSRLGQTAGITGFVVAPVAAFVWVLYQKQQTHNTDIAVLKAETASARLAHDREIKEIRETTRAIMAKLDSIEEALRK